ncbi:hypothetical protein [Streptomyces sp. NRRL S-920]|uniref:hypothetical protein n=1 Tax=Streptomyces sp. NRRL S-920 TaxID=1463921 RepID=UPI0004CC7CE3|nr:hypothetical protein [Streptomyces sp. NRRL S-920]
MDLTRLYGTAEIVAPLLVFMAVALRRFRTGMQASWREEAEAYRSKVDRQEQELSALRAELREVRRENQELHDRVRELLNNR